MPQRIHFSREPEVRTNGRRLAGILNRILAERDDDSLVKRLATAAGISVDQVQRVLAGEVDFPTTDQVRAFAAVLQIPDFVLSYASADDSSEFVRGLEPTPANVETLTVTNCASRADLAATIQSAATRAFARHLGPAPGSDADLRRMLDAAAGAIH